MPNWRQNNAQQQREKKHRSGVRRHGAEARRAACDPEKLKRRPIRERGCKCANCSATRGN